MSISKFLLQGALTASLALALGCASAPMPVERIASAKAAIRSAAEVGATGHAGAKLHLQMAQDELARAEHLMAQDENELARGFLMRAEADAELALALARQANAESEASAMQGRVRAMETATQ